jgi:acyl-CoA synthetase (AMP-forming)/AMP-acid ligase II
MVGRKGFDMLITTLLTYNAKVYPQEISLIEREPAKNRRRELTWREFEQIANQWANALLTKGIKKGDRVALLMTNCLEWLPAYLGILKTGALAVPLNFRFTAKEIKTCLQTVKARALLYGPEFMEKIALIKSELDFVKLFVVLDEQPPVGVYSFWSMIKQASFDEPQIEIKAQDEAALYFTSGTTGKPKPIVLTQANLTAAAFTEKNHHQQTRRDNFLCIPPLYHTGAKIHWLGSLLVGGRAVLLRGVKPEWILETVFQEKVSIVWLLVPWAQDILDALESKRLHLRDYQLKGWRLMHIGAQPVPPSLIQRWRRFFPWQKYDTNYGLSEATGPGCIHLGIENIHKVGAIGKPGFNWQAKIVDSTGQPVPLGKEGELIIKGPGVMKGYYKNSQATAQVLKNGWLFTGDIARKDQEGFIYLVDRKKDVIIMGGENIYPVEIEDFLRRHEKIRDVALIGLPDQRLGEIPAAIVEVKAESRLTEEEVLDFCQALPRYKRPRMVFFDQIPRNPTGKIEKTKLRKKYGRNDYRSWKLASGVL